MIRTSMLAVANHLWQATPAALHKLGLELKSTMGDAEIIVIDPLERPTAN